MAKNLKRKARREAARVAGVVKLTKLIARPPVPIVTLFLEEDRVKIDAGMVFVRDKKENKQNWRAKKAKNVNWSAFEYSKWRKFDGAKFAIDQTNMLRQYIGITAPLTAWLASRVLDGYANDNEAHNPRPPRRNAMRKAA